MDNTLGIIAEILVLIFNVLIFMQLTVLKKDSVAIRLLMYIGTAVILINFFVCTYFFKLPEAAASFVCITIPTAVFYWSLSKYKDARFFTTFCFLDTVTYIIVFFARAAELLFGSKVGVVAYIIAVLIMFLIYVKGRAYFKRYRELLGCVKHGWISKAISVFLIYVLLVFATGYPKPLIYRPEYLPVMAMISVTVLSFYAVFIMSLFQKKKLYDLNIRLQNEQALYEIAYMDALTGLKNRMAYIEYINELERKTDEHTVIYAVMIDIDNFKNINDTQGHYMGDIALKKSAEYIENVFSEENYEVFRIGGDEFAVTAVDLTEADIIEKLEHINDSECILHTGCTFSAGYAKVDSSQNRMIEMAFIRADQAMYEIKSKKSRK